MRFPHSEQNILSFKISPLQKGQIISTSPPFFFVFIKTPMAVLTLIQSTFSRILKHGKSGQCCIADIPLSYHR